MKIYRVSYRGEPGDARAHKGFTYHCSLRAARMAANKAKEPYQLDGITVIRYAVVAVINVTPTKAGIIAALNIYGGHPAGWTWDRH